VKSSWMLFLLTADRYSGIKGGNYSRQVNPKP
jgi:hypothetical protein